MVDKISAQNGISPVMKRKSAHRAYGFMQPAGATDEASFSPFAKELGRVMGELEHIPEVRQDKINDFKKQIAEGTYNPDLIKVAHSLLMVGLLNEEE